MSRYSRDGNEEFGVSDPDPDEHHRRMRGDFDRPSYEYELVTRRGEDGTMLVFRVPVQKKRRGSR